MKKNLFRNVAYISTVLFLGFLSLYLYAEIDDPHPNLEMSPITCPHVSFGNVNVTVTKIWGGDLIFFNQSVPYTGSIIGMAGDKSISETGWDGWGIYFRSIKHTVEKNHNWWTLMISLWYPIIIFGILPAIFVVKKLRKKFASQKGNQ